MEKQYLVKMIFDVYEDDYNEGEGKKVNEWNDKFYIKALYPGEAIKEAFNKVCFSFEMKHAQIDEVNKNVLHYSNLVDNENIEADEQEIKDWKEGKIKLYSANSMVEVLEITEAII